MIVERQFHNVKCDHCGRLLDDETWWDEKDAMPAILGECGWIECEGGRHYCDECWEHDDDDNIVTKDGRKWTDYDHKEILPEHKRYGLDYLKDLCDPGLTITQIRMEIIKAQGTYQKMVGSIYKWALYYEIEGAMCLLSDRKKSASESEKEAYDAFQCIFYRLQRNGFPNNGKDVNIY